MFAISHRAQRSVVKKAVDIAHHIIKVAFFIRARMVQIFERAV